MGFPVKVAVMVEEKRKPLRWDHLQNQQKLKLKMYLLEHPKQKVKEDQS